MRTIVLTLGFFLFISATAFAVPAYPGLIKMKQPDGAEISLYMRGDEKVHWMESEDGYSLLYDADKNIVYAVADEENNMVPSSIVARNTNLRSSTLNNQLKNIPKGLKYSSAQINTLHSIWNMKRSIISRSPGLRASTGTAKTVCALIGFQDKPLVKSKPEFEALMNQVGYNLNGARGSVKDYYLENSYGNLDLEVTVTGPFTATRNWAYYGKNNSNKDDEHPDELAIEAANQTFNDPDINPADYDNDGDGWIDAFHVIYAGYGEESGAPADAIWAHEWGFPARTYRGKKLDTYSCSPELRGNSGSNITHIGVICHEFGHVFGAPDFYDADGEDSGGEFRGTGWWDLMANGSWNGVGSNRDGSSPAHINMYQKIKFGWVNPVTLSTTQQVNNIPNSAKNAVAYRINTPVANEYFVLENRQQEGFDSGIPGHGLLIYRVSLTNTDISKNIVNVGHQQKMYPVCASSTLSLPTGSVNSYGSINSAGCPFPGSSGKTSFTDETTPSAKTWDGTNTDKPVTNITEVNKEISFQFSHIEENPPALPVQNLRAVTTVGGQAVRLEWDSPFKSDWMSYTDNYSDAVYYDDVSAFSAVVRFTEADLKDFKNSQLTKVKFYVHNTTCRHKIQVWQVTKQDGDDITWANGNAPIHTQTINSATTGIQEVELNTPVRLEAGKELWIGINYEMDHLMNTGVAMTDNGPMVSGDKNLIWDGQWWLVDDEDDFNWYISGYVQSDGNLQNIGSSWLNSGLPQKYSVYCDNTKWAEVTDAQYIDPLVPSGSHIYCVSAVYAGNLESEKICTQIDIHAGIEAVPPATKVLTYPNPIGKGELLTIETGEGTETILSFYTVSGQLIRQKQTSGTVVQEKIDFAQGIYILQIKNGSQILNRKIVVK